MGSPASVPLPVNVAPQQTVDVSVSMTAPDTAGHYEGLWQLQSADGKVFGVGDSAAQNIWVRIRVIPPAFSTATATLGTAATSTLTAEPSPTATLQVQYDFAANPCDAQWQSNTGILACPGTDGATSGFILRMDQGQLEDGSTISRPTLLTFPQDSADGYILGVYPDYQVQYGDHFQASVGCEKDATSCSVLFRLSYLDSGNSPHDLWTLGEFYDGKYFNLDLDLSQLSGQTVKFILDVSSLGSAAGDRALWVDPRIVHFEVPTPTSTITPTATLPTDTPTPSPTATTAPATATSTPPVVPTPVPANPTQAPSIQKIFESIISFFQQIFGSR